MNSAYWKTSFLTSSPCMNAGDSQDSRPTSFLFHRALHVGLSPRMSYTASADLTSRMPYGRCGVFDTPTY